MSCGNAQPIPVSPQQVTDAEEAVVAALYEYQQIMLWAAHQSPAGPEFEQARGRFRLARETLTTLGRDPFSEYTPGGLRAH